MKKTKFVPGMYATQSGKKVVTARKYPLIDPTLVACCPDFPYEEEEFECSEAQLTKRFPLRVVRCEVPPASVATLKRAFTDGLYASRDGKTVVCLSCETNLAFYWQCLPFSYTDFTCTKEEFVKRFPLKVVGCKPIG